MFNFLINSISIYHLPFVVSFTLSAYTRQAMNLPDMKIQRNFLKTTITTRLKCPICFEVFFKPRRLFCGYFLLTQPYFLQALHPGTLQQATPQESRPRQHLSSMQNCHWFQQNRIWLLCDAYHLGAVSLMSCKWMSLEGTKWTTSDSLQFLMQNTRVCSEFLERRQWCSDGCRGNGG